MKPLLSPKELSTAVGASESSIKRWVDQGLVQASRTAGGHRRIPLAEAIRFIRESRLTLVRPDVLGMADMDSVAGVLPDMESAPDRLCDLLKDGRAVEVRGLIMSLYLSGHSLAAIIDGPMREAMDCIGEMWKHGAEGIFIEHRASDICVGALNQIRLTFSHPEGAPLAIGGAPSGDHYSLPSLGAATVLAAEGFHTMHLGMDTPFEAILRGIEQHKPRLVWLSLSTIEDTETFNRRFHRFLEQVAVHNTPMIIGGRMKDAVKLPESRNVFTGSSMAELVSFARGLMLAPGTVQDPRAMHSG